ncbi:MAG TPA: CopD family protein [Dehalococcoidia bacterium]|nr:CopD family protein [Dehalococcoidia bacterium]
MKTLGVIILAVLLGLAVLLPSGTAKAHSLLVGADPEPGAKLAEPPDRISAWFTEPLEPSVSRLRVLGAGGAQLDDGEVQFAQADPTRMSVGLSEKFGPGFYLVTWETLSQVDGHFRFSSFEFTVLNPDGSEPTGPRPEARFDVTGTPTGVSEGALTKFTELVGIVLLVGVLASALIILPAARQSIPDDQRQGLVRASRRYIGWLGLCAVLILTAVGAVELWLQARQFGGLDEVSTVLDTDWGERWILRHFLLFGVALFLFAHARVDGRLARGTSLPLWLGFGGALGYMFFVSLVSHANAVAQGSFWATASDFVHLITATLWIGGLVSLAALFFWSRRSLNEEDRRAVLAAYLQRFSLLAVTSLLLLLGTGLFNGLVELSSFSALIDTAYGRALLAKLLAIVPLLIVAGLNAVVLRPRFVESAARGDAGSTERLRLNLVRLVALEAGLAMVVLAIVGVLTQYTSSRVEADASAALASGAVGAPAAQASDRDAFGYPLSTGDWYWVAAGGLALAGLLLWIWSGYLRRALAQARPLLRIASVGLAAIAAVVLLVGLSQSPSTTRAFDTAVALRYQATGGQLVLLEIDPFQPGPNGFKVTTMTESEVVVGAQSVELRFSDLEDDAQPDAVPAAPGAGEAYFTEHDLERTGWWVIEVVVDDAASATFYLRLDRPSLAPLEFAPPDYESDPAAEQLFRETVEGYEGLRTVRWREELTSGLLDPTGIGAWVISDGQAEAPDKNRFTVFSPNYSDYQTVQAGSTSCTQRNGEAWECRDDAGRESFGLDYMEGASAFRFGRREMVEDETAQVLLFNNGGQAGAWYAWWIGEETGYLRRQAMVAPGHFMLTNYFGQNEPVDIELPDMAARPGG